MGEAVVFLSGPGAGFDIIDAGDVGSPACFAGHFVEFAVLDHHCVDNPKETLVARQYSSPASERIP